MITQVALVDDEASARDYIRHMKIWNNQDFSLAICASGANDLIEQLSCTPVDIILMDVSMPDMDGMALSSLIHGRFPQIDMIAISNYDDYAYVRQVMMNGAKDYLLKHQLTEETLKNTLSNLIARRLHDQSTGASVYRKQLRLFLEEDAPWPFPKDGSLSVPCFGTCTLPQVGEEQQTSIVRGILELAESCADEEDRCIACDFQRNRLLLLLRIMQEPSRGMMEKKIRLFCLKAGNHIREVYHLTVNIEPGPILMDQTMLPEYIRQSIRGISVPVTNRQIFLTMKQRTELSTYLMENNTEQLKESLEKALLSLENDTLQTQFLFLRSLVDLIVDATREWQMPPLSLPQGNELLEWINRISWKNACSEIIRVYLHTSAEHASVTNGSLSAIVRAATELINTSFAEQLTLASVAESIGVSEAYLTRLMKKELGSSFNRYLTGVRMEHARAMLLKGLPMKQIAQDTGYIQYTHFLHVFKQNVGITPKEYIKKNKNQ